MRSLLAALVIVALAAPALSQPSMHEKEGLWLLWSQHSGGGRPEQYGLWWRTEAGPFGSDECRAAVKKATSQRVIRMTAWYDITPQRLEQSFGQIVTPDKGTWVGCWPVGLDFDRDLVDR